MSRKWLFSLICGLTAFFLTFVCSLATNTWKTALTRALIGFVVFLVIGLIARLVLSASSSVSMPTEAKQSQSKQERSLHEEKQDEASFQAMSLEELHSQQNAEKTSFSTEAWLQKREEG
ncbi:hypothetical protein PU629_13735 [Pullulanibacillus sp. KACC 23026]|uniref:hypothetical protein n=1 Tax=Pullulanibacillus sp. KACC 23026 TaxID=3028315 RepID=UPI0023B0A207|nr:hypothetical protein [Pullulanibacillus sp. KACC 23026]WEG11223.1 hypothetical protein PU629_13735 [Pullulanibacillus sp. KACC 23026]